MRQPYRIESITLRDIGVFENTRFDFPPIESLEADEKKAEIHIFTGPNGCGKSTLLYALAGIFLPSSTKIAIAKRFRNTESKVTYTFNSSTGQYRSLLVGGKINLTKYKNELKNKDITDYINITSADNNSLFYSLNYAAFAYSGQRLDTPENKLSLISEIQSSPFENALSFNQTARADVLMQWIANNRTQAALARVDNDGKGIEKYESAINRISTFIYDVCSIKVNFKLNREPLAVSLNLDGNDVFYDVLPDGLKSIICWVADLALRLEAISWRNSKDIFSQPIILFLDEVDIHLHPKWQRRILPAIQTLLPNAQVFVSTHSPFVVGSVEDAWVYRLPDPQQNICRDSHIPETIQPAPSSAGKSYQLILDEVFGVPEQFDVETEKQLDEFYRLRQRVMENKTDDTELKALANTLTQKGEEVGAIVSMELRQLARLIKQG
ncbi:hemin importer ATP-binding subunit [Serratia plymuthica]|nr:hemin importer ATP-binding subunit [Serratia plymuthica]